jgi:DNA-binding GntR family transcriptional regulator
LRSAILLGEFLAGSRLIETQIAEKLQVSRTPIREALQQLQLAKIELAIQQAENAIAQQPSQLTSYQLLHIDYQFHRAIAECSGNTWLALLLDQLFDKMALLRIQTVQQNLKFLEIHSEHRCIYDAIVQRDHEVAVAAISNHLMSSQTRAIREIEQLQSQQT